MQSNVIEKMATSVTIIAMVFLSFVTISCGRQFPDFVDAFTRLHIMNNSWKELDKAWSVWYDEHWLQWIDKNSTLQQSLSSGCFQDLSTWLGGLQNNEMWAIQS